MNLQLAIFFLVVKWNSASEPLDLPSGGILPAAETRNNTDCPAFQWRNNTTGQCMCFMEHFSGILLCDNDPYDLRLQRCFCMTYTHQNPQIGSCQYTCTKQSNGPSFSIIANDSNITEVMCGEYKRKGQMCGSCEAGYAPPVYSYSLSCVNCTTSNWAKYIAVSLLPLTAFFVFVVIFRISATSPTLHGFILCIQIIFSPTNTRLIQSKYIGIKPVGSTLQHRIIYSKIILSIFGIWNLDFFRSVYTPFCLHPDTSTLQVLALDYIIAVYPLLLIGLSYLLVLLYDHNVRLIVCLWKPFVPLFIRFRRQWNIRNSLVDAFATFFLLSYVKILSVSVDLLMPVELYDQHGNSLPQLYLFNQGDVAFLGSHHLPYACLAIFFLLTFTLLPMFLLFLYPCSCFQRCLNRTGCSCHSLHIFMDTFQGHYKNGTNGTRDYRFISGLFFLIRIIMYASFMIAYNIDSYAYSTFIIIVLTVYTSFIQPYKKCIHNIIETLFLVTLTIATFSLFPLGISGISLTSQHLTPLNIILCFILLVYIPLLCVLWFMSLKFMSKISYGLKSKLAKVWKWLKSPNRLGYETLLSF